jgi:hypothetical protein
MSDNVTTAKKPEAPCDYCGKEPEGSTYFWHYDHQSQSWLVSCSECHVPPKEVIQRCSICGDTGWYMGIGKNSEPEQMQCERCFSKAEKELKVTTEIDI